ncbi:hypothetical protein SAMN05216550_1522 [Paraburkholderia tropica]|uniref:Uncharacterized protein n=1 Tax=Paraburkholderia tropica TaxID=92647 RepID=A0AAQ1GPX7_9BURK|nr:hypothetical protein SAMN05216550_1522 [Paraburkholderia tropica]
MGCTRRLRHEQRRNEGDAFGFPGKTAPRNGPGTYVVALIKHLRTRFGEAPLRGYTRRWWRP